MASSCTSSPHHIDLRWDGMDGPVTLHLDGPDLFLLDSDGVAHIAKYTDTSGGFFPVCTRTRRWVLSLHSEESFLKLLALEPTCLACLARSR